MPASTSTRSWATRSAGRRSSASRCSRPGHTRIPATSRRRITCRRTRRSITTRSPMPTSHGVFQKLTPAQQKRLDPMITGFNPADMYAADHIRRVLETLPGRVQRHRRIHDPQGVRLVEGGRRYGEPDGPGARQDPRFRRPGRTRRHPAQRHRHAVCEDRCRAGVPAADQGPAAASSPHDDHLGAHGSRTGRAAHTGSGDRRSEWSAIPGISRFSRR